jgi:hypothetical protein
VFLSKSELNFGFLDPENKLQFWRPRRAPRFFTKAGYGGLVHQYLVFFLLLFLTFLLIVSI